MNSVSEVALYKRLPEKEVPKSNTETNSIEYKRWEHLQEIDTDVEGFLNLAEKIRFENLKKKDEHVVKVKSAFETIREEKMNSVSEVALYERLPETEAPKSNNETNSIEYKVSEILKEKPKDRNTENQLLTSIWDYGGQYIYYATHQIFHSADAVYILVFDLTKDLERYIVDCDFPERNETMKNCLKFWVDSVDAVVGNEECTQPTIILVGTHKNSFQGDIERKFEEVVDIFKETGVRNHIYKQHFAVDNTDFHDEVFEQLRKVIHGIGKKHLEKRKIPAKWIPLEFALLSKRGSNILTLKEVETIDKSNKHPIRDEKEIKLFLKYHHGKGTVIYFDEDILDKFIVVNPVYLIDAFKCIISSNRFCKWDRDLHPLWTKLVTTAVLENKLVYEVWRQHGFQMHIDVLLLFLQRHRVLSEILLIDDDGMVSKQNKYFIPSMVKQNCTEEVLLRFIGRKQRTTVLLGYRLDKSSTSGHVYERITTAVLGKWSPIWFNGNLMVFRNAGLYRLDKQHAGVIFLREGKGLEILVINQCESQKVNKRVSDRFRRYVESAITFEFSRYCNETRRQQYSYYFVCNHSEHIRISGSHNIYEIEEVVGNDPISCPENLGHSVHPMQARQEWFLAENIFQDEDIPDRNVTDEDLSRIAESLGENWQLLGIRLGLRPDELQRIRMDHETSGIATTMFYMLYTWKNISIETGGDISFSKLISTMSDCEQLVVNWDKVRNIVDNF